MNTALCACLLATAVAGIADPAPTRSPHPMGPIQATGSGPTVVLEALDGTVRSREPRGFRTRDPRELDAALVRFEGFPAPELSGRRPAILELIGGDRLHGELVGGEVEDLFLQLPGGLVLRVPIDAVASLRFPERIPAGEVGAVVPAAEGDRLFRAQGRGLDRIDGTVEEFTEEGVRFDGLIGLKLIPWGEVAAVFVEDLGGGEELAAGGLAPVVVDLVDQSRLRGRLMELSDSGCRLETSFGQEVQLPAWYVSEVVVDDGRLAFLSDVPIAAAVEGSAFGDDLGMTWPHRRDLSVTGLPLTAGGRTYTRGIGVHSPSRLTWELDGGWKALRGLVAVDDQVRRLPAQGSVIFRIHVDGRSVWESGVVHGGEAPLTIPTLSLEGARELTLEVDMASDFYVADRADWLRVLLAR